MLRRSCRSLVSREAICQTSVCPGMDLWTLESVFKLLEISYPIGLLLFNEAKAEQSLLVKRHCKLAQIA